MPLVNSPKIKYRAAGAQEQTPIRIYLMRGATYVLLGVSAILFLLVWLGGDVVNQAIGRTGIIQGVIVNEAGQPMPDSEVSLAKTPEILARTDANGFFQLSKVPVGTQSIVVSIGKWGQEYPVTIQRRSITDAGTLIYLTTPVDD